MNTRNMGKRMQIARQVERHSGASLTAARTSRVMMRMDSRSYILQQRVSKEKVAII